MSVSSFAVSHGLLAGRGRRGAVRLGIVFCAAGLLLGSGLVLLAHPLFALGVWEDTQPMVVGLLVAGALCFLGMAWLVGRSRLARRAALHPATLMPFAMAVWSLLASPWVDKPARSIFGTAQSGQGVLWYLALSACVAAALTLYPARRAWRGIVVVAAASSLLAAILGVQGLDWLYPWLADHGLVPTVRLLHFNEYLAYPALALAVLALAGWLDGRKAGAGALGLIALAVLLLSRNRTAWLVLPMVFAAVWWGRCWLSIGRVRVRWLVAFVALVAVVPLVVIVMADDGPLRVVHSLWSRSIIVHTLALSLADGAGTMLVGHGWGAVPDELVRNLPASGVALYESRWGGLGRDIFHSHNAVFEALFSAGVPGAFLALMLPAAMLACGRRRRLWLVAFLAVSWAALDAFWFMVPASPPVIALAIAAAVGRPRRWSMARPPVLAGAALAGAVLTAGGGGLLAVQAVQESRLIAAMSSPESAGGVEMPMDLRGDGHALAAILTQALPPTEDAAPDEAPARARRALGLQASLAKQDPRHGSATVSMAMVNALTLEAFAAPETHLALADDDRLAAMWGREVRGLLRRAPLRLDAAAPYFNWLMIKGRDRELAAVIADLKALDGIDATHPVLLWFDGSLSLWSASPAIRNDGLRRMRRALRDGLERFFPVDDAVKQALR